MNTKNRDMSLLILQKNSKNKEKNKKIAKSFLSEYQKSLQNRVKEFERAKKGEWNFPKNGEKNL